MSEQGRGGNEAPMKVGIAGLGFGATEFLPSLEPMPQLQIVAGADLRPQALQAFQKRYPGSHVYDSVAALCADPEVEAVWIATPNQFHGEHALLAAQNGKHSVVRKPLATTIEECQRVVDVAEKNGVHILGGGQTQGTNALIQETRRMIVAGDLGPLRAINLWAFTGWMLRPRMAQEVDDDMGGGIVWRQAPHQLETVRWLGGGNVRSVRAITGRWRPERPNGTGYFTALLEFEDGTPATIVYNAYGYFDSVELIKWGNDKGIEERARSRKQLLSGEMDEETLKEATRFGGMVPGDTEPKIPWETGRAVVSSDGGPWMPGNQGVFIVSLEGGDVRAAPNGLYVYDNDGLREVPVAAKRGGGMAFMDEEAMELYNAVRHGKPMLHDGRWGMATAEVQWAILESAKQRKEIMLQHQVPVPAGY
jgi:phthalate 4,5-cis-dihydrodiol dehydrogenase